MVLFSFFLTLLTTSVFSQTGLALNWNVQVGCQQYSENEDPRNKTYILLEDIEPTECLKVCQNTKVTYNLTGDTMNIISTNWIATGGVLANATPTSVDVTWGNPADANLSFQINTINGLINSGVCLEIIRKPIALFTLAPANRVVDTFYTCLNQTIYFSNLSNANGGSNLVSYLWDFGDGSPVSTAFEPNHIFTQAGDYKVTLTVTNQCNCSSSYTLRVVVRFRGFDIKCPSTVCSNTFSNYSLPPEIQGACLGVYNWSVIGGQPTINQENGDIKVLWNQVNVDGFGYVTFNPSNCALECLSPTTIKIPVIQQNGTIKGQQTICLGDQEHYTLPQWPSTDFQWKAFDSNNNLLNILIPTDQRNEVVLTPTAFGVITLKATYFNTLLHCGGKATFTINVNQPEPIAGNTVCFAGQQPNFQTLSNNAVKWILTNSNGGLVHQTTTNSNTYSTNFTFTTVGTYFLTVSGTGVCNNQKTSIKVITAPTPPVINSVLTGKMALTTQEVCPGAPYNYAIANPDPFSQYTWTIQGGGFVGTNSLTTTGTTVTAYFNSNNVPHQITATRQIQFPVIANSTTTVYPVSIYQIQADISDKANLTVNLLQMSACANNYSFYRAVKNVGSGYFDQGESYVWTLIPESKGSIVTGQGTKEIKVLWNNFTTPQNASIKVEIKKCNLTANYTKSINIIPAPSIQIIANSSFCSLENATFSLITNLVNLPIGTVVNWSFSDATNQSITVSSANPTAQVTATFNNNTEINQSFTATAFIATISNCIGSVSNVKNFIVTSGSKAALSFQYGNNFCQNPPSPVTTLFSAAISPNANIVGWYLNGNQLSGQTGLTLNVQSLGLANPFGLYYFKTLYNGCYSNSNLILIANICQPTIECNITPSPVVTFSASNNCGQLTLNGSASSASLLDRKFTIIGPSADQVITQTTNPHIVNVKFAGIYACFYSARYYNPPSTIPCVVTLNQELVLPFVPDLKSTITCTNTLFTIALSDNSSFMGSVTNRTFLYKIGTSATGPWTTLSSSGVNLQNATTTQAGGNYFVQFTVGGTFNGVASTCTKVFTLPQIAAIPTNQTIVFTQPNCHDKAVKFQVSNPQVGDTYLWMFDSGVSNTLTSPERVFAPSTLGYEINVIITNQYGCQRTLTTPVANYVNVPPPCYFGNTDSVPINATVCKGQSVLVKYINGQSDNCTTGTTYQWYDGLNAILGATASTLWVNKPGSYRLILTSANGCVFETEKRTTPVFNALPSAVIVGNTIFCADAGTSTINTTATCITDAATFDWTLNGAAWPEFNNDATIELNELGIGTHTLVLNAMSAAGCSSIATQYLTVSTIPEQPSIAVNYNCLNHQFTLTATAGEEGTFLWSNGKSGAVITEYDGGPYQVWFNNGNGCIVSQSIFVPYSSEKYLWTFPTGCYSLCQNNPGLILGPNNYMASWEWNLNNSTILNGNNSYVAPLPIAQSGTYDLELNSGNGCILKSDPMEVTLKTCKSCAFKEINMQSAATNYNGFCSYTVVITFNNDQGYNVPTTLLSANNKFLITPQNFTAVNNFGTYSFNLIPINGFTSGTAQFIFSGILSNGEKCNISFTINLPPCNSSKAINEKNSNDLYDNNNLLSIYPNPAKGMANIQFETEFTTTQVVVFDLQGRQIATHTPLDKKGIWNLATQNLAAGVYVVVLKKDNQILAQQKLVVE